MGKPVIGILTWRKGRRFAEPAYFRRLIRAGRQLGCAIFLFSPVDVNTASKKVRGFVPADSAGWESKMFAWPDVVIDRYRYIPDDAFKQYVSFRKKNSFLYANNRLANKWRVHDVLWRDQRMHRWLPETELYSHKALQKLNKRHPLLYVKPVNGTGGRGIVRLQHIDGSYLITGSTNKRGKMQRELKSISSVQHWLDKWVKQEKYVLQQGLCLQLLPGRAVDMRLLIQKNGEGKWSITGSGIRVGAAKSAISNLHGGGKAVPARSFLLPRFGEVKTDEIIKECELLALQTANTIEAHFGRMIELGLDIGIDVDGRAWLIEVNPKPGREIFKEMGAVGEYQQAIRKPLQYALFVAESHGRKRVR